MAQSANRLCWTGKPGHYEVYYLTVTDPSTGVGLWIRYTMLAPLAGRGDAATCSLWFLAMDPREGRQSTLARHETFPVSQLRARDAPFELELATARLTDASMTGAMGDVSWDLHWTPAPEAFQPVNPLLGRLGVAKTVLVLPHADVALEGSVVIGQECIGLNGARGGQAHLWGSKHATTWAWAHCNDLRTSSGSAAEGAFFDAVSAVVARFGRSFGPNTPVVGRFEQQDFHSTSPRRILNNSSRFELDGWRFEAAERSRRIVAEVRAPRGQLAGVTYHDPDGELAYCYNTETASVHLELFERHGRAGDWQATETLVSEGRCHFEFGTRRPVPGIELLIA